MSNTLYDRLSTAISNWLIKEKPPGEIPPYDFNKLRAEIRPGDVLLIEGRSRVSNVIQYLTRSPWSHAALYIGRFHDIEDNSLRKIIAQQLGKRENVRLIIEGVLGQGTIITRLKNYKQHHIRICRPIGLSTADAQLIIAHAIHSIGKPYNVRHIFDLARFLLPWSILPRRWGSSLFRTPTGKPESGICSSLLAEAFASVHFPILPLVQTEEGVIKMIQRNPHLFTPKDFDYSPYFEIIKYPLLSAAETPYYRRLPWSVDALYHDEGVISQSRKISLSDKEDELSASSASQNFFNRLKKFFGKSKEKS